MRNLCCHADALAQRGVRVDGFAYVDVVCAQLEVKLNDKAFFMYGLAKNQQSNISDKELKALKLLAAKLLAYDSRQLATAIAAQELYEGREDHDEA